MKLVPGNLFSKTRFWFCLSLLALFLIPQAVRFEKISYEKREPYFTSPLTAESHFLTLRRDSYGKGYFGASRNGGRTHQGIDISTPVGEPILAAKSGRVVFAGRDNGYGNIIEIRHPDGLWTRYAHLSELFVREGDWVTQRQAIGKSGKTGNASNPKISPHLHFEIRGKGQALNPVVFLDPQLKIS